MRSLFIRSRRARRAFFSDSSTRWRFSDFLGTVSFIPVPRSMSNGNGSSISFAAEENIPRISTMASARSSASVSSIRFFISMVYDWTTAPRTTPR